MALHTMEHHATIAIKYAKEVVTLFNVNLHATIVHLTQVTAKLDEVCLESLPSTLLYEEGFDLQARP